MVVFNEDKPYHLYARQDGLYNTHALLITDEYTKSKDLPPYWYNFESGEFKELVIYAWKTLFDDTCAKIHIDIEDRYTINLDDVKRMIPERFL